MSDDILFSVKLLGDFDVILQLDTVPIFRLLRTEFVRTQAEHIELAHDFANILNYGMKIFPKTGNRFH